MLTAEAQAPGVERSHVSERVFELAEHAEEVPAAFLQPSPRFGEIDALTYLLEQRHPDRGGELLDLQRRGGLCHVQLLRGHANVPSRAIASNRRNCGNVPCLK